jgi:AcrR family transcriptional regulator
MSDVRDSEDAATPALTRDRIKAVASDLYVLKGFDGFSFGDIAAATGMTRANIHHHFGSKRRLMHELVDGYTADAEARIERFWASGNASFPERLAMQLANLRSFYDRFNRQPGERNVWSPLSRVRLDLPALGEEAEAALERVNRAYEVSLRRGVEAGVASGELRADLDIEEVVRILRVMLLACPPITQDSGSFDEIEAVFAALGRLIVKAD